MKQFLILFLIISHSLTLLAQTNDSIKVKKLLTTTIFSTTLITTGSLISSSQFEKDLQIDIRNKVGNDFRTHIDDFLPYLPVAGMYIADIFGVKSKNHWFDQTKYLLISNVGTSAVTHLLKNIIQKTRPDGTSLSFPSGHTSFAFNNASVFHNEFRETFPILAYSGYLFSTTTGSLRIMNNKHWFSDVLTGAGIAILVTELVYYFEPLKNFNPFLKTKNISFVPQINTGIYGFYFTYKL